MKPTINPDPIDNMSPMDPNHPIWTDLSWMRQYAADHALVRTLFLCGKNEGPDGPHRIVILKRAQINAKIFHFAIQYQESQLEKAVAEVANAKTAAKRASRQFSHIRGASISTLCVLQWAAFCLDLWTEVRDKEAEVVDIEDKLKVRREAFEGLRDELSELGLWAEVENGLRGITGKQLPPSMLRSTPIAPLLDAVTKAVRPPLVRRNATSPSATSHL